MPATPMTSERCKAGFVLCPARSGSTLLRYILDSHPQIACPPETNLSTVLAATNFTCGSLFGRDGDAAEDHAARLCRSIADATLGHYARSRGKSVWIDKSLTSIEDAELLAKVFPEARFICLYRECTALVMSGLEASPWGLLGYGFAPYVAASGNNHVLSLGAYWADKTEATLAFEERHEDRCHRVRYEDLVLAPEKTVSALWSLLDVEKDESFDPARVLSTEHDEGPGDHKIRFTSAITVLAVTRGWQLPIEMMPPPLHDRINSLLERLEYPRLDAEVHESLSYWGDQLGDTSALIAWQLTPQVSSVIEEHLAAKLAQANGSLGELRTKAKIVIADQPAPWIVDFQSSTISEGNEDVDWGLITDSQTLIALASGQLDPAAAIRTSRLRAVSAKEMKPGVLDANVAALVRLLSQEPDADLAGSRPNIVAIG